MLSVAPMGAVGQHRFVGDVVGLVVVGDFADVAAGFDVLFDSDVCRKPGRSG
jgi:hypothetical protein